ncbi:AHH domain-containing protein [Stigmatella sp. ncwal1]|uniref:AHH domain-containing protein n=1 Tax=Stigmatella ashevillensis TaxID=2995309 RepID=A0ABT5D1Z5_9BACT|nr:AHH domain-containing protein [Stigmatella ashevillena]MDC0707681.1 AHH domain-containing protein [Stigmatella ashevillena]
MTSRRLIVAILLLVLSAGCSTTRVVRLDTGQGQSTIHVPHPDDANPVELGEEEFIKAIAKEVRQKRPSLNPEKVARELFEIPPRSGWYRYTQREGVVPLDEPLSASQWAEVAARVTQEYLQFCEAIGKPGDCRNALMNSPVLTGDGRYALGMSFAIEEIVPEMKQSFKDMADPETIKASLYWTMAIYAAMWLAPEPVFSKGLATVITATFVCYIGVDTFWTLIQGFRRMVEELDHVTSFAAVREAGRTYGKVMGKNAARAFALLLTAAIGQTAASFSAKVPTLLGSAQASAAGAAQAGIRLTAVAQVEAVAVTADAVTITLAPNAVAATAQSVYGAASKPVDAEGPEHHIATDKWNDATHSGGPWTPTFKQIFNKAGMSLDDPANKVRVKGHVGPHPQEYHEYVFEALRDATRTCRTMQQCQVSLKKALDRLRQQILTESTYLNKLVTRTP